MSSGAWRWTLVCQLTLLLSSTRAAAYRPFDQTDASVADYHTLEIEFGPVAYLREPAQHLLAPGLVLNFGFLRDWELVAEARGLVLIGGPPSEEPRARLIDTALSVKTVLRQGVLQDRSGPSVALEMAVLVPSVKGESGIGASVAGIVSQRLGPLTVHWNLVGALSRTGRPDFLGGAIVEGPFSWPVRPVAEAYGEWEIDRTRTYSALAGAIWNARSGLTVDAAVRAASENGQPIVEVRAGLTWTFAL